MTEGNLLAPLLPQHIWYFSLNLRLPGEETLHEHATKPPVCPKFLFLNAGTAPYREVAHIQEEEEGGGDGDDLGVSVQAGSQKVSVNGHIEPSEQRKHCFC